MCGARTHQFVEHLDPVRTQLAGLLRVLDDGVPKRDADDVRPELRQARDVRVIGPGRPPGPLQLAGLFRPEPLADQVPQPLVILDRRQPGRAGIEVEVRQPRLHHQRTAEVEAAQDDDFAGRVHDVRPAGVQPGQTRGTRSGRWGHRGRVETLHRSERDDEHHGERRYEPNSQGGLLAQHRTGIRFFRRSSRVPSFAIFSRCMGTSSRNDNARIRQRAGTLAFPAHVGRRFPAPEVSLPRC